jgi:integrase/recombinase XerD
LAPAPPPTDKSSLAAAIGAFEDHMLRQGFTDNTRRAFRSDLRLLTEALGRARSLESITIDDLQRFLAWMARYRGVACSPKTYQRRVTTLKVFFAWLTEVSVLAEDPALRLVHRHASAPLPGVLTDDQVAALLDETAARRRSEHPDPRPDLLVRLILYTGVKKGECMRLRLSDIDRDADHPTIFIRYEQPRRREKQRRLLLTPELIRLLTEYLAVYRPREYLFECTARNLEYVLADVTRSAGMEDGISFETLRWTCALRDHRAGMPAERLRHKLGLSPITWAEVEQKLQLLASAPL